MAWLVVVGGYMDFIVWMEELKRPGSSENLVFELLRAGLLIGVPAGLIGVGITALVRWTIRKGWWSTGDSAN